MNDDSIFNGEANRNEQTVPDEMKMGNSITKMTRWWNREGPVQPRRKCDFIVNRPENRDRESPSENYFGEFDARTRNAMGLRQRDWPISELK